MSPVLGTVLKTLGIPWEIGVSLFNYNEPYSAYKCPKLNIHDRLLVSREGLATPEIMPSTLEGWNFQPSLPLKKGRGLEMKFNHVANNLINHAYIMNPPIKTETMRLQEFPGWLAYPCAGRGAHLGSLGSSVPSSIFHCKYSTFSEFCEWFWRIIKPEEGSYKRKEIKLSLLPGDMTVYMENLKESIEN